MDLVIQKGITEPKKKSKKIIDYAYQQQKKKRDLKN